MIRVRVRVEEGVLAVDDVLQGCFGEAVRKVVQVQVQALMKEVMVAVGTDTVTLPLPRLLMLMIVESLKGEEVVTAPPVDLASLALAELHHSVAAS